MANDIIGVGLSTADHLFVRERRGIDADHASEFLSQGGGLTATAVAAAGRLGASVEMWAVVGDDFAGEFVRREFAADNVDTSQVCIVRGGQTATCAVIVDAATGERRFVFFGGRGIDGLHGFDHSRIDTAKCLLVDAHTPDDSLAAARHAREVAVPVVADIEGVDETTLALARLSDILIVPEECAADFSGGSDPAGAIAKLRELGPRMVVITMGDRGGAWAGSLRPDDPDAAFTRYDAFEVDVVDTTGCGDVFHGAFAFGLTRGWLAEKVIRFASATAALKCRKLGGRSGMPTLAEVDNFLGT